MALFDNEEIGSVSAYGADSNMMLAGLERLCKTEFADGRALSTVSKKNGLYCQNASW